MDLAWWNLVVSAIASIAAIVAAVVAIAGRGVARFAIATEWYDGIGGMGRSPWSGTRRGCVDVTLRNLSGDAASDVRLITRDCRVEQPVRGLLTADAPQRFTLTDVGENAQLIVTFRPVGRGWKRTRDVRLDAQRPAPATPGAG